MAGRRVLMPDGHPDRDRLMRGCPADAVTVMAMDAAPAALRPARFDPPGLDGFRRVDPGAARNLSRWRARLARAAGSIPQRRN